MKLNQQHESIYTPYCYLIGWSKQNKFYYGVRYSKKLNCIYKYGCHPDDLWVSYFTSSKYVKDYRLIYGEPDIIQVRRTFKDIKSALIWESRVIKYVKSKSNNKWLNKNYGSAVYWDDELKRKVIGRVGSRKNRTMQEMQPGWVNPVKGKTSKERYKGDWVCYRKGKSLQEIWGDDYIDPRSIPFIIISQFLGELKFNNVADCTRLTGLDGISIINLKRTGVRKIRRRSTTKHIFTEGDILYLKK